MKITMERAKLYQLLSNQSDGREEAVRGSEVRGKRRSQENHRVSYETEAQVNEGFVWLDRVGVPEINVKL